MYPCHPEKARAPPMPATPGSQPEKRLAPLCPIWKTNCDFASLPPRESARTPIPATPGSQPEREQRYVKVGRGWKNEMRLRNQSGKTNCDFVSVPPRESARTLCVEKAHAPLSLPPREAGHPDIYLSPNPPFTVCFFLSALPYCEGYGNCAYDSVTSQCLKFG